MQKVDTIYKMCLSANFSHLHLLVLLLSAERGTQTGIFPEYGPGYFLRLCAAVYASCVSYSCFSNFEPLDVLH